MQFLNRCFLNVGSIAWKENPFFSKGHHVGREQESCSNPEAAAVSSLGPRALPALNYGVVMHKPRDASFHLLWPCSRCWTTADFLSPPIIIKLLSLLPEQLL